MSNWRKSVSQVLLSRQKLRGSRKSLSSRHKRKSWKKIAQSGWLRMKLIERQESNKKKLTAKKDSRNTKLTSKSNFRWNRTSAFARKKKRLPLRSASRLKKLRSNKVF